MTLVYTGKIISPFLCGHRKNFSTKHTLLTIMERWNFSLDKKGFTSALLMNLSKAFDTLNHELSWTINKSLLNYTRMAFLLMHSKLC